MRLLFITYCVFPLFALETCSIQNPAPLTDAKSNKVLKDTSYFKSHVQPILVKNCSPCHFTGGKMYVRLPFDHDTTIIHHEVAILKRIKDEKENAVIRSFILQNKNGSSTDQPLH